MALLTATDPNAASGIATITEATLTADDTLTIVASKKQVLILRNDTGGLLTATLDGDLSGNVNTGALGLGVVDASAGKAIPVAAGAKVSVVLNSLQAYTKGVVHLLGGTGLKAQLFNF